MRSYLYAYVAVCPGLGQMTALILPSANTEMMNIFLHQVSQDYPDYFIVMLIDQAGWHRSNRLEVPENIHLIEQPAYSPELNPVEHIWEELREKNFPNKAFRSLDEVEEALCEGLGAFYADPVKLRAMTNFPYLNFTC